MSPRLLTISTVLLLLLAFAQAKITTVDRRKIVHGETTTFYITNCHTSSEKTKTSSVPTEYSTTTKTYSSHTPQTKIEINSKSTSSKTSTSNRIVSTPATVTITPIRYVQSTVVATVTPTAITTNTISTTAITTDTTTFTSYTSTDTTETVQTSTTSTQVEPSGFTPLASAIAQGSGRRKRSDEINVSERDSQLEIRSENCVKYPSKVKCCVKKNVLVPEKVTLPKRNEINARDVSAYTTFTITAPEVTRTLSPISSTITLQSSPSVTSTTDTTLTSTMHTTLTATTISTIFTATRTTTIYTSTATVNAACERADNLVSVFSWFSDRTVIINSIDDTVAPAIKMQATSAQDCCNLCFSTTDFNCQGSAFITKDGIKGCYLYKDTSNQSCANAQSLPIPGNTCGFQYAPIYPQFTLSNGPCSTFVRGDSSDTPF